MPNSDFDNEFNDIKPLKQDKVLARPSLDQATIAEQSFEIRRQSATQSGRSKNFLTFEHIEQVQPADILSFKVPGLQEGVFRKLRLGKYTIEAKLDLHRRTVAEAIDDVFSFIKQCLAYELRTIQITHGKGKLSNPPAILKSHVNKWLRQIKEVQAFHSCLPRHGGSGAVYVLLAKSKEKSLENREFHKR